MSKGSEQFSWRKYPSVERVCAHCRRPLLVRDVGRIHNAVTAGKAATSFYCREHRHEGYGA